MLLFPLLVSLAALAPTPADGAFIVEGELRFIDGDRLLVACGESKPCVETLIRDERLQRQVVKLQGRKLRLRVERVPVCGPLSSEEACMRGGRNRTALRIMEWLDSDCPK
jgi:hypothetical protein